MRNIGRAVPALAFRIGARIDLDELREVATVGERGGDCGYVGLKAVGFPVPTNLNWIEGVKKILDTLADEILTRLVERKAPDSERRRPGYASISRNPVGAAHSTYCNLQSTHF